MKKILYFLFLFVIGFILIGCNDPGEKNEHTEHTFGPWQVTMEKSCNQEGEERRYCECGYEEIRHTGFGEHNYRLEYTMEPTCSEQGRKVYRCEYCGDGYDEMYGEPSHRYELTNNIAPSCGQNGYKTYSCPYCGDCYEETIPAPECEYTIGGRTEPTCTTDGYIEYVCNTNPSHTYQETIPATGKHTIVYEEQDENYHIERCENCYEHYIGGLSHIYTETIVGEGTCLSGAEIIKECKCGYKYIAGYLYEHNYLNDVCSLCNEHKPSEGLEMVLYGNSYIVAGIGTCKDSHIYIPSKYLGKDVIAIGNRAFKGATFTDITIPASITYFGEYAFVNCNSLKNVYYNGSLKEWMNVTIAESTGASNSSTPMYYAEKIYFKENKEYYSPTTIIIPEDVEEIKAFTFAYFNQVSEFIFNGDTKKIGIGSFTGANGFSSITLTGVEEVSNAAFYNATNLTTITFDETLRIIGPSAFYYCTSLDNVVIPEGTKTIYDGAFNYCTSLKKISIPNSIESFGQYMFERCSQLEYYEIDGSLYLGNENNNKLVLVSLVNEELTKYVVDENTKLLLSSAFDYAPNITDLTIHENVIFMGFNALRTLSKLERLEMPLISSDTYQTNTLSAYATNLDNLKHLKITSCSNISSNTLELARNIEELILPNDIKQIGSSSLSGFNNLKSLTIPYISYTNEDESYSLNYLFNGNTPESLKELNITNALFISSNLLQECNNFETLTIPNNLMNISFNGCDFTNLPYNEYENGKYLGSLANPYHLFIGLVDVTADTLELHNDTNVIFYYPLMECPNLEYTTYKGVKYMGAGDNLFEFAVDTVEDNPQLIEIHDDTKIIYEGVITNRTSITVPAGIEVIYISHPVERFINDFYYKGTLNDWMNLVFYSHTDNPILYSNNFYYSEDNEFVLLDELVIPSDVTHINDYQFYGANISKLVISENVTNIGEGAFAECRNLNEITINSSIDYLPKDVFAGCMNIYEFNLPTTIKHLYEGAFRETNINTVYFDGTLEDWLEISFDTHTSTPISENTQILFNINGEYNYLTSIDLQGNVEIGDFQFYNFRYLENVNFNFGITSIGVNAFENTSITSIYIPDSVSYIGTGAFKGTNLRSINVPFLGNSIDDDSDATYFNLIGISIPTGTDYYYSELREAVIRGGYISDYAFYSCYYLSDVTLPNVTSLGDYAFASCNRIDSIKLPDTLQTIGSYCFLNTSFDILTIPSSVSHIETNAFMYCGIEKIYYEADIQNWMKITFDSEFANPKCNCEEIYFLNNGSYSKVTSLVLDESISYVGSYQLVNFGDLTEIYIHENVNYIGKNFLKNCYYITNLTVPFVGPNVDDVSDYASLRYFFNVDNYQITESYSIKELTILKAKHIMGLYNLPNLEKITIPNTLEDCETYIYAINDKIKEIHYKGTLEQYMNIFFNSYIEVDREDLMKLYLLDENNQEYLLEDVVVPSSISVIQTTQFAGIKLNDVYLHQGITDINAFAFYKASIRNVYYDGNESTWFYINIDTRLSAPAQFAENMYFKYDNEYYVVTELTIPDDVYYLKDHISGMKTLETLVIGESMSDISYSFNGCDGLDSIYVKKDLLEYDIMGFRGDVPLHKLYLLDENGEFYQVTDLVIDYSTTMDSAFTGVVGLKSFTLLDDIQGNKSAFNQYAFSNCPDLEDVKIYADIYNFEYGVFSNCPKLKFNTYENGNYIGNEGDPYRILVSLIDKTVSEFKVHNDVEYILCGVFSGTSFEKLTIPFANSDRQYNISFNELWGDVSYDTIKLKELIITTDNILPRMYGFNQLETITFENGLETIFDFNWEMRNVKNIIIKGESTFANINKSSLWWFPSLEYNIYNNGKYIGTTTNPYQVLCGAVDESLPVIPHESCTKVLE